MSTFNTLPDSGVGSASDLYITRQGTSAKRQTRDKLAASLSNARWIATENYLVGSETIGSDNKKYIAVANNGVSYTVQDPTTDINEDYWRLIDLTQMKTDIDNNLLSREVDPLNNDWNGYLDPSHTVPIEYYDTSTGTRSFSADTEIAPNLFVSAATDVTFSDAGISWLSGNSIYKQYRFTSKQLADIDISTVSVFVKDESGNSHYLTNSTTGVSVTKPDSTTIKVEITFDIFSELGITSLWRFFVTENVGSVVEIGDEDILSKYPVSSDNFGLVGNYEIILASGSYSSGTFSYPVGRSEDDYDMLILISTDGATLTYNPSILTKEMIAEPWNGLRSQVDTSTYAQIVRASSSSFTVTGVNLFVKSVIGYLKEGIV